jgi:putative peptidoglycan lipid II flippase
VMVSLLASGDRWGSHSLVVGSLAGVFLQCVVLGLALRRSGVPLLPHWRRATPDVAKALKQYLPVVLAGSLTTSNGLVDQAMAAILQPGSVAALSYGGKTTSFLSSLGAAALGAVVLPHFSRMVSTGDWRGIRHTLNTYTRIILACAIPLTVAVFALSAPIVSLLFERGAFSQVDTKVVAQVQAYYILQLPWYVAGVLAVRLLSALSLNHVILLVAAINFLTNVVLNYVLMRHMGVSGIALSTSMVYLGSFIYCWFAAQQYLARVGGAR